MAEFKHVTKELIRSRKAVGMDNEPLIPAYAYRFTDESIDRLEREILQWSKEHPEPQYPTWATWLESMGVLEPFSENGKISLLYGEPFNFMPTQKMLEEIPQDMAKKLNINPIIIRKEQ